MVSSQRAFTVTPHEVHELAKSVKRKLGVMRMFTELKDFNY